MDFVVDIEALGQVFFGTSVSLTNQFTGCSTLNIIIIIIPHYREQVH
jgi:hypothetical protein